MTSPNRRTTADVINLDPVPPPPPRVPDDWAAALETAADAARTRREQWVEQEHAEWRCVILEYVRQWQSRFPRREVRISDYLCSWYVDALPLADLRVRDRREPALHPLLALRHWSHLAFPDTHGSLIVPPLRIDANCDWTQLTEQDRVVPCVGGFCCLRPQEPTNRPERRWARIVWESRQAREAQSTLLRVACDDFV